MNGAYKNYYETRDLKGVGGWLLLFCFLHVVLAPIVAGESLYWVWVMAVDHPQIISIQSIPMIKLLICKAVLLTLWGTGVGIALWCSYPPAALHAKIYLLASVTIALVTTLLATRLLPPTPTHNNLAELVSIDNFRTLILNGIWLAYFLRSERVRQTYDDA